MLVAETISNVSEMSKSCKQKVRTAERLTIRGAASAWIVEERVTPSTACITHLHISGSNRYGLEFRVALRRLQGFDGVFGCESSHQQCELTIVCHLDRSRIDSLDVGGSASAADHFHNKFYVFHIVMSSREASMGGRAVHRSICRYNFAALTAPHSRQRAFRDVINPQDEHILCARNPPVCGFSLNLQRSSRMVKSTINTPKEILVAFIE
jgi:hypothetical protein